MNIARARALFPITALVLSLLAGKSAAQTVLHAPSGSVGQTSAGNSNVGVGTSLPGFKFEVVHDNYNAIRATGNSINSVGIYVTNTAAGARQWGMISSGGGPSPAGTFTIWDDTAGARFNIAPSGYVGVGSTSPASPLTVRNNAVQLRLETNSGPNDYFATLTSRYDASHPFSLAVGNNMGGNSLEFLGIYADGGGANNRIALMNGPVGIGTTSPLTQLHLSSASTHTTAFTVQSTAAGGGYYSLLTTNNLAGIGGGKFSIYDQTSPAHRFTIDTSGNIGVGNPSPGRRLEVNHDLGITAGEKFIANFTQTPGQNGLYLGYRANGSAVTSALIRSDNNLPITFGTSAANEAVSITNSGNVGIGTTNPTAPLTVRSDGPAATTFNIQNSNTVAGRYSEIAFSHDNGAGAAGIRGYAVNLGANNDSQLRFYTALSDSTKRERMIIDQNGNVGIGTTNPTHKLSVNGTIRTKEVIVESTGWADYVLKPDYRLAPLSEVESAIQRDGHLPGIPSAREISEQGLSLGEMQARMMAKIEELTLHQIMQQKELQALKAQNHAQNAEITALKTELSRLADTP